VVTGYQGVEQNPIDGSLVVRQSLAHAWAEYWQPGEGWLRADPTAAVAPERIDRSQPLRPPRGVVATAFDGVAPNALLRLRDAWEATNHLWNRWVLNYTRGSQFELLKRLGFEQPDWRDLASVLIGLVVLASSLGAFWAWREQRRADPWLRAYARVRRVAEKLGIAAGAAMPPRGLAALLVARHGHAATQAADVLHRLEALRYARPGAGSTTSPRALAAAAVTALQTLPRPGAEAEVRHR
jgi:hypothetical protein